MLTLRNWSLAVWSILFGVAIVFGGGGANYGFLNLIVQIVGLLAIAFRLDDLISFWRQLPVFGKIVVAATIALPIVQSIPLPPQVWQALPGRDLVHESLALIGSDGDWFSISIDWRRTLLAATALVAPFAAAMLAATRSREELVWITGGVLAVGLFSLVLGMVQIASGNEALSWYTRKSSDQLFGFFANRNSAGLFFVIALICLVSLPGRIGDRRIGPILFYGSALVLALGTVLTQSRSSTLLLAIPFAYLLARRVVASGKLSRKRLVAVGGGILVSAGAVIALVLGNDRLAQTWGRFASFDDMRWDFWRDTLPAIQHYWPVGSGMGTYRDTIEVFESLESISPLNSGRAHNEYLELALESGMFGLAVVAAWMALTAMLFQRALARGSSDERHLALGSMLVFAAIALQSVVDYPLRSQALLCVAASMFGVLIAVATRGRTSTRGSEGVEL